MAITVKTAENFSIDQGADFSRTLTVTTDGSTAYEMRKSFASSTASATFTCTVVSGSDGTYKLTLTDTVTAALDDGRYLYDVELILGDSTIEKVHHGIITVLPEATKI